MRGCQRMVREKLTETATAFIRGLNATIRLFVIQRNPNNLQEAIQATRLAQESSTAFP